MIPSLPEPGILNLCSLITGGLIDWGHHSNNAQLALSETALMAKAVKKAQEMTKAGLCTWLVLPSQVRCRSKF